MDLRFASIFNTASEQHPIENSDDFGEFIGHLSDNLDKNGPKLEIKKTNIKVGGLGQKILERIRHRPKSLLKIEIHDISSLSDWVKTLIVTEIGQITSNKLRRQVTKKAKIWGFEI